MSLTLSLVFTNGQARTKKLTRLNMSYPGLLTAQMNHPQIKPPSILLGARRNCGTPTRGIMVTPRPIACRWGIIFGRTEVTRSRPALDSFAGRSTHLLPQDIIPKHRNFLARHVPAKVESVKFTKVFILPLSRVFTWTGHEITVILTLTFFSMNMNRDRRFRSQRLCADLSPVRRCTRARLLVLGL